MLKNTVLITFITLAILNIAIFIKGIKLTTELGFFDKETNKLHQQNLELEKQAYDFDSLQYAASVAASLDFTQKTQLVYLDNLKIALK